MTMLKRLNDISVLTLPMVKLSPNLNILEFKGIGYSTVQN